MVVVSLFLPTTAIGLSLIAEGKRPDTKKKKMEDIPGKSRVQSWFKSAPREVPIATLAIVLSPHSIAAGRYRGAGLFGNIP
jgi:hypothetical protein